MLKYSGMGKKQSRLIITGLLLVFVYLGRGILSPFLLAIVIAYILNPLVNFIHKRLRAPRLLSVTVVYLVFLSLVSVSLFTLTSRVVNEVRDFRDESVILIDGAKTQLATYPDWAQSLVYESIRSLENATLVLPARILPIFTGAVSQLIQLVLFLATTFYLLKDSEKIAHGVKKFILELSSTNMEPVLSKIAQSFALFLRGELFLVALMSSVSFLALSFLGVKYALILGIFTGFAEIIPIIGPIVATVVATAVAVVDGNGMYSLTPLGQGFVVVVIYFILRQLEDVAVIPQVMGKITKVHPLLVMFAVVAGGHLAGFWGLLLAVPVLSAVKIIIEYYW